MEERRDVVVLARDVVALGEETDRGSEHRHLVDVLGSTQVEEYAVDVVLLLEEGLLRSRRGVDELRLEDGHQLRVLLAEEGHGGLVVALEKRNRQSPPLALHHHVGDARRVDCCAERRLALLHLGHALAEVLQLDTLVPLGLGGRLALLVGEVAPAHARRADAALSSSRKAFLPCWQKVCLAVLAKNWGKNGLPMVSLNRFVSAGLCIR